MDIGHVTVFLAFAAGLASFLSPCVLPLVPAYLAYLGGRVASGSGGGTTVLPPAARGPVLLGGAAFVLGLSLVFILLFYALLGIPEGIRQLAAPVAGVVVILLALHSAGLVRLPMVGREIRALHRVPILNGPGGGLVLGMAFAAGWTPCIGPTLGAVLTSSEVQGTTAGGLTLMIAYCCGLGIPFLVMAGGVARAAALIRGLKPALPIIQMISVAVLFTMGILLVSNHLTVLSQIFGRLLPASLQVPFGL
ncbi:MAG TPA: cytochrome c biogenesis protein CcdA [Candidatus Dormibacteraeota bacterium]|jgi:cytochrome c-type biogenesis protein|nr:cytochrome c biogenesis protein CcdA [Candidatus Dormibacteraeota bacterium]